MATLPQLRGPILVLATVLLASGTAEAASVLCRLKRCDDGNPCTVDSCRGLGVCVFEPVPCDDGDACTVDRCDATGACRHTTTGCDDRNPCTTDACDAGACVNTPVDGEPCPDDGFACTDDACSAGTCLHVPIDSRCVAPGECASAACAPLAPAADGAGCLAGAHLSEGAECTEDGEPCTDDVCRAEGCTHMAIPDAVTCEPVTRAFRLALVLVSQARGLAVSLEPLARSGRPAAARALERLAQVELALRDAARTLAGKSPLLPAATAVGGLERTPAQLRAVAASGRLADTPGLVREFLVTLRGLTSAADAEIVGIARERARALRRGVRRLKAELRRLRRVQQTFVP